jgi:hypothetical protein
LLTHRARKEVVVVAYTIPVPFRFNVKIRFFQQHDG